MLVSSTYAVNHGLCRGEMRAESMAVLPPPITATLFSKEIPGEKIVFF